MTLWPHARRDRLHIDENDVLVALSAGDLSPARRLELTLALQRVGTEQSIAALRDSLKSPDTRICVAALHALCGIGTNEAIDVMIDCLPTANALTVGWAAHLLARAHVRRAIPPLTKCLADRGESLTHPGKAMLIQALGALPHRTAVPVLTDALWAQDRATRVAAARALAHIRSPESRIALETAARKLSWIRGIAIRRVLRSIEQIDE